MIVLLSIKPEFALKIFNGSKRYEYRRVIYRRDNVEKVIVYASNPIKKLIGEFEIDRIIAEHPIDLWNKTKEYSGVSEKYFFNYFYNVDMGYAIKIKSYRLYEPYRSLDKFLGVPAPQSFRYLDREPIIY